MMEEKPEIKTEAKPKRQTSQELKKQVEALTKRIDRLEKIAIAQDQRVDTGGLEKKVERLMSHIGLV